MENIRKMKTLSFISWKGGTSKTTLGIMTAETCARHGYKVLIIDIDPNCSTSEAYGYALRDENSKQLLFGNKVKPYHVKDTEAGGSIDIIPADVDLNLVSNCFDTMLKNQIVKNEYAKEYDLCIIDPPGSWCSHTRNAIFAADKLVVCGACSALDFIATVSCFNQLKNCMVQADVWVVVTRWNSRVNLDGIIEKYKSEFKEFLYETPVPEMRSLRRLTADPSTQLHPTVQARLIKFVSDMTGFDLTKNKEVEICQH